MRKRTCAVIVAAGSGRRMGAKENKVFLPICDTPVLAHTLKRFQDCDAIDSIIVVTRECDIMLCRELVEKYSITKVADIVDGGASRQESVYKGLQKVGEEYEIVAVHDGARALIGEKQIVDAILAAQSHGAAAVGVKCKDTLKSVDEAGFITGTVDREYTYNIQTPQAFKRELIIKVHEYAIENGIDATDDCALIESFGERIKIIDGSYDNIKITTPEDLAVAENILKRGEIK